MERKNDGLTNKQQETNCKLNKEVYYTNRHMNCKQHNIQYPKTFLVNDSELCKMISFTFRLMKSKKILVAFLFAEEEWYIFVITISLQKVYDVFYH